MKEVSEDKAAECSQQDALAKQAREELFQDVLGLPLETGNFSRDPLVDYLFVPQLELPSKVSLNQAKADEIIPLSKPEQALPSKDGLTFVSAFSDKSLPHYSFEQLLGTSPELLPRVFVMQKEAPYADISGQLLELKSQYQAKYDVDLSYAAELQGNEAKVAVVLSGGEFVAAADEAHLGGVGDATVYKATDLPAWAQECIAKQENSIESALVGLKPDADKIDIDDEMERLVHRLPPGTDDDRAQAIYRARMHGLDENLSTAEIDRNIDLTGRQKWADILHLKPGASSNEIVDAQGAILAAATDGMTEEEAGKVKSEIRKSWEAQYVGIDNVEQVPAETISQAYAEQRRQERALDLKLSPDTPLDQITGIEERRSLLLDDKLPIEEVFRIRKARLLHLPDDTPASIVAEKVKEFEAQRGKALNSCWGKQSGKKLDIGYFQW